LPLVVLRSQNESLQSKLRTSSFARPAHGGMSFVRRIQALIPACRQAGTD